SDELVGPHREPAAVSQNQHKPQEQPDARRPPVADTGGPTASEVRAAFGASLRTGWQSHQIKSAPPAERMIVNTPPAPGEERYQQAKKSSRGGNGNGRGHRNNSTSTAARRSQKNFWRARHDPAPTPARSGD